MRSRGAVLLRLNEAIQLDNPVLVIDKGGWTVEKPARARRGWICISKPHDSYSRAGDGYGETIGESYQWRTNLANGSGLAEGDVIMIRNGDQIMGFSFIESIKRTLKPHESHECPFCKKAQVEARSTLQPRFRCKSCKKVFTKPIIKRKSEEFQVANYAPGWVSVLDSPWFEQDWKLLSTTPKAQLSIQKLEIAEFQVFKNKFSLGDIAPFDCRDPFLNGGHRLGVVRIRVGQAGFRERLLNMFGNECAMTGSNHPTALEAAHLYSYSTKGVHHQDGGLLLRRDIHRLFDSGLIAIDPSTRLIAIAPELKNLNTYSELQGQSLKIELNTGLMKWIDLHWKQHQSKWVQK